MIENDFGYLTPNEIRGVLDRFKKKNFIITGNYNNSPYDKTTWYAMTNISLKYFNDSICEINKSNCEINQPIPYINNNINTDIKN